jgi:hypothetical protein
MYRLTYTDIPLPYIFPCNIRSRSVKWMPTIFGHSSRPWRIIGYDFDLLLDGERRHVGVFGWMDGIFSPRTVAGTL